MTYSEISCDINFASIRNLLESTELTGRKNLFEHEVYKLLDCLNICSAPEVIFIDKNKQYPDDMITAIPGDRVVLKIVSTEITHKTDVGGVRVVENNPGIIRSSVEQMIDDVSCNYAVIIEGEGGRGSGIYHGLSGDELRRAVKDNINGVLAVQHIPFSGAMGSELILSLKYTREFGMVLGAGLGGTDTELFSGILKKDASFVTAAAAVTDGTEFLSLFKNTVSYKKLAGHTRGQQAIDIDASLVDLFSSFIMLGNCFSISNPDAAFVIDELEINPFILNEAGFIPLDGLCRFSRPEQITPARPQYKINSLLHPKSIGIIGVSTTRANYGQIILNNIIAEGFDKSGIRIIRPGIDSFKDVVCVPDLESLDIKLDLLVVAVGAGQVPGIIDTVTEKNICESVMLIPGGIGETGESKSMAKDITGKINKSRAREDNGPVFLGANSLGVVSHPGKYDTLFIPEEKLPKERGSQKRNIAFISQSGAFMITRLSKRPELDPAYMISIGNQTDLTLGDMISYFKDKKEIDVIGVYAEGFKDMDGLCFIRALREAVLKGKSVVVYKAGRTAEGRSAAASHTASIAGDYRIFESCVKQAGGMVADDFTQFQDLLLLAGRLSSKKIRGSRVAAVSGAGFEAVGMADCISDENYQLELASFSDITGELLKKLMEQKGLLSLTEIKNPLDLNPGSDDETHLLAVKYLAEDDNVDAVIAGLDPLSPATDTLLKSQGEIYSFNNPDSIVLKLSELTDKYDKPIIGVIDAGKLFDPMAQALTEKGMIIFRSADRAVKTLAVYMEAEISI